jgi:molybdate transport system regulatory protein
MAELWLRIDLMAPGRVGPGKVVLLERIDALGSISAAGRALGMSYKRAWQLVDELNRSFRLPVVATHMGGAARGGAKLTECGKEIVRRYRRIEEQARRAASEDLAALQALAGEAPEPQEASTERQDARVASPGA